MKSLMNLGVRGALLALAAGLSAPAAASVYTFEWHGTVGGGITSTFVFDKDYTNVFGAGYDLSGQAITVSVRVDTATPGAIYGNATDSGHFALRGLDSAAPLGVSITINGVTYALDEDHIGGARFVPTNTRAPVITVGDTYDGFGQTGFGRVTESAADVSQVYSRYSESTFFTRDGTYVVSDSVQNGFEFAGQGLPVGLLDMNVDTPPPSGTWTFDDNAYVVGVFEIFEEHESRYADPNRTGTFFRNEASASFRINSVTVRSDGSTGAINAVPEPASWAMMLMGFCLLGASVRRGRAGGSIACA